MNNLSATYKRWHCLRSHCATNSIHSIIKGITNQKYLRKYSLLLARETQRIPIDIRPGLSRDHMAMWVQKLAFGFLSLAPEDAEMYSKFCQDCCPIRSIWPTRVFYSFGLHNKYFFYILHNLLNTFAPNIAPLIYIYIYIYICIYKNDNCHNPNMVIVDGLVSRISATIVMTYPCRCLSGVPQRNIQSVRPVRWKRHRISNKAALDWINIGNPIVLWSLTVPLIVRIMRLA